MSSQSGFYFTTPISNDRSGEAEAQHHIHRQTEAQGRPCCRNTIRWLTMLRPIKC